MSDIKVAKIINNEKLVLNVGSEKGVEIGHRYMIYYLGDEINDPDTQENLGNIEIICGTGKIIHVQEKISTLESDMVKINKEEIIREPMDNGLLSLNPFYQLHKTREIRHNKNIIQFESVKVGYFCKRIND